MENEESCEHCSAILLPRRRAPVLCESCVPICDDSCAHFDEDKPTPVPTCASSDLPARIVRALADYGCLSDGGGIEDEEPSEEDTEEMERVARGVVATMLSAKPPTVHVLDDDEIAERIATAACDALDACEGDADDAFEQAKRAIVCEVKLLLALPSPIVETEPEHEDGCASQYEDTRDPSVTDVVCACDCKLSAIAAWSGDHCTCDHGEGRGETLWCDLGILIRAIGISDPMRYLPDYTTTVTLLRKTWEALNNSNARDSMMEATRTAAERLAAARTKEPTP